MSDKTITISLKEYNALKEASKKLDALEAAGVDNWEGYDEAMGIEDPEGLDEDE